MIYFIERHFLKLLGIVFVVIVFSWLYHSFSETAELPTVQFSQITLSITGTQVSENFTNQETRQNPIENKENTTSIRCERGTVMNVVDGDTIDVDGIRVRLIGINTPETKDPNKSVECYGPEATAQMQKLVSNQRVCLLADTISDDVDIYGRKLRYVLLSDGTNVNAEMLKGGYSKAYNNFDFDLKSEFTQIANTAQQQNIGIYSHCATSSSTTFIPTAISNIQLPSSNTSSSTTKNCNIKGNINAQGVKIYHIPGCENYNDTIISTDKGEKRFCTEQEAKNAGRRKAYNC